MGDDALDMQRASCLRLLAHDLNNPLTAIRILAEMIQDEVTNDEMRRDMNDVLEAADLATALIDGMASMLRLEGGEEEYTWFPLDLVDLIQHAVDRPALRRHVQVRLPPGLQMGGDRRALLGAFTDLLVNARRLVEGGAPVEVMGGTVDGAMEVRIYHPGLGVPGELRDKLFELYGAVDLRREHRIPVTAVGLAYAKHVVQRHGGTIRVVDAPGGMDVVVRLPR